MGWSVKFSQTAIKQLKKIDKKWQAKILDFLEDEIAKSDDPRIKGKVLTGDKKGFWRYRVGHYRIVCDIKYQELIILALTVGHRKDVYKNK
ncbi:MAG: type II toxin-antitoxin system RelE/ParE family toxin [Spirochaetales bacterium]|nr:type II toxin-antitoxin system RelE/ParE family toxin [Spirochaetales bacterium]